MSNFNLTMIEGYLVKDPSTKTINDNTSLCTFVVGSNKRYQRKSGEQVNQALFIEVSTWRKMADICGKYLKKGSRVLVSGNLRKDVWEDKEGHKQSKMYLEGREVNFLGGSTRQTT